MSSIILPSFNIVGLVELLIKTHFCVLNFLVKLLDDFIHVLSLAHLTQNGPFEFEHGFANDPVVKVDHVARYLRLKFGILIHDWLQFFLAKPVGVNMVQCFVKEFGLVTEQVLIATNYRLVAKLHVEIASISICKTDTVLPVLVLLLY